MPAFNIVGRPPRETHARGLYLNAQDAPFSARGDGLADDSAAVQAAIDEMFALVPSSAGAVDGGGTVYLPEGHYIIDNIVLRYGVRLVGMGAQCTKLIAKPGSTAKGLITLDTGIVAYSGIENLKLTGDPTNTGQHGMYMHAVETSQVGFTQGGWWNSHIRHVAVEGFDGEGIWLHGGGDNFLAPIQFIDFHQVEVDCPSTTHGALRMSGECNQIKFLGSCRFNGPGLGSGNQVVKLERTVDPTTFANNGDIAPDIVDFSLCSVQSGKRGMTIERAQNVKIDHVHFESLHEGVKVDVSASNVVIEKCDFANTGKDGSGTGYCVLANAGSTVVQNNSFAYSGPTNAPDQHYVRNNAGSGTLMAFGQHKDDFGMKTTNLTHQMNAAGTIDVTGRQVVFVNTSGTSINTITDNYAVPGSILVLKAHNGPITLASGGNIYFDSTPNRYKSPLIVPQDTFVLLMRIDLGSPSRVFVILAGAENGNFVRPFGCNGATPQSSFSAVFVPPSTGGTGVTAGAFDSALHRDQLISLVANIRTALINDGIMTT